MVTGVAGSGRLRVCRRYAVAVATVPTCHAIEALLPNATLHGCGSTSIRLYRYVRRARLSHDPHGRPRLSLSLICEGVTSRGASKDVSRLRHTTHPAERRSCEHGSRLVRVVTLVVNACAVRTHAGQGAGHLLCDSEHSASLCGS